MLENCEAYILANVTASHEVNIYHHYVTRLPSLIFDASNVLVIVRSSSNFWQNVIVTLCESANLKENSQVEATRLELWHNFLTIRD